MAVTHRPRGNRLRWVVALAVLAGGIALYLAEWEEVEANRGYTEEAWRNPYLAAHEFLAAFDVDVRASMDAGLLQALPPVDDVLLISGPRRGVSDARHAAVLEWLEAGGHLIVLAHRLWDEARAASGDPLLDTLGVYLQPAGEPEPDEPSETLWQGALDELAESGLLDASYRCYGPALDVWLEGDDAPIKVRMPWANQLTLSEAAAAHRIASAANDGGTQLVQLTRGRGIVTVVTGMQLWRNTRIGCDDHAHLLRHLVGDAQVLHWLAVVDMPALPALIWASFPAAVLLAAAALLLWLWHALVRPGPVVAHAEAPRRALLEHADGVARFLWQQQGGDTLLRKLQDDVGARLLGRAGGDPAGVATCRRQVATECGLDPAAVEAALAARPGRREGEFVEAVRTLELLRKHL